MSIATEELLAFKARFIAEYGEGAYWAMLSSSSLFKRTYYGDFTALIHDCIDWRTGEGPTKYQDDILDMTSQGGRVAIQSLHGVGKTTTLAWVNLAFSLTRDGLDWKAINTASAWRQLKFYLFPEIRKWSRRILWGKIGRAPLNERTELQKLALSLSTGECQAAASDNPGLIEGAHADKLAYVFDESKLVPAATFDAAEGAFAGAGAQESLEALAVTASTPGPPSGRFYDICRNAPGLEKWRKYRITIDQAIAARRVSPDYPKDMARLWGVNSSIYKNKVEGEFAAEDSKAIIPLAWVEAANLRYLDYCKTDLRTGQPTQELDPDKLPRLTSIGADISDGGEKAYTVIAPRYGDLIANLDAYQPPANSQVKTANKIAAILEWWRDAGVDATAVVDGNGVGSGVVAILQDIKRLPVVSFIAMEGTDVRDESGRFGFRNLRTLAYWHLRELLNPERTGGSTVALPPIPELTADLTTPTWREIPGAKIALESKEDIGKRLEGRSTDFGDAVAMAFVLEMIERVIDAY